MRRWNFVCGESYFVRDDEGMVEVFPVPPEGSVVVDRERFERVREFAAACIPMTEVKVVRPGDPDYNPYAEYDDGDDGEPSPVVLRFRAARDALQPGDLLDP